MSKLKHLASHKFPSRKAAERFKSPITKHLILYKKLPEGTKKSQLGAFDKQLLQIIEWDKQKLNYRRKNLSKVTK